MFRRNTSQAYQSILQAEESKDSGTAALDQLKKSISSEDEMSSKLVEQMARIATTIHGNDARAMNPCGSGKIESLLQFASTYLPELDLFLQKLTSMPQSEAVKNEYFGEFNRVLFQFGESQKPNLPTDDAEKAHLQQIYVTEQNRMTQAVFNHLYTEYQRQLLG